jgi:uncharacterized protein (DUF2147 family)
MRGFRLSAFLACLACGLVLLAGTGNPAGAAGDASGLWLDDVGDGIVDIRPCGGNLCGYIQAILKVHEPGKPLVDNRNQKPELRSRPLCGLQIMGGLKRQSAETWGDGWVYDPKEGKTYNVEITLQEPKTLAVRGYVGVRALGRTVLWKRPGAGVTKCK